MTIIGSSVNLFNCRYETGWTPGEPIDSIQVDSSSSLVAYEQRYNGNPNDKIFVNSISYDSTNEIGNWGVDPNRPAPWIATSVWGPLRAVPCTKQGIILSEQFSANNEPFNDWNTNITILYGSASMARVLGSGSNRIIMNQNMKIYSQNVIGTIYTPGFYIWSIHTYLEQIEGEMINFYGRIVSDDDQKQLGHVYFKNNQWACSYGMKWIDTEGYFWNMRLVFTTLAGTEVSFYITDYQIIRFDDLEGANSYLNSREFALPQEDYYPGDQEG